MASLRAFAPLALVLTLAGCTADTSTAEPATAVTTTAAPPASPSTRPARPQFQTDWEACSALVGALPPAGDFDPVLLTAIGEAATRSADTGVRLAGQFLIDYVKLAVAAKGGAREASTHAGALKAGSDLLAACRRAKLLT